MDGEWPSSMSFWKAARHCMMFTRPPGLPIIGDGVGPLMSTGNWMASWSPKLSRMTLSDRVGSFHSMRKAIQPELWTARTVS
jgi:hypothetical protein